MTSGNPNSHRFTNHDKCVVESLNDIIRHQNVDTTLFEQLLDHHQSTDADEDTQDVMVSVFTVLQYIASVNNSSKSTISDRSGNILSHSLSSTANLHDHTTPMTKACQLVPVSTTIINDKSMITAKQVSTSAIEVNLFPNRQLSPRPTGTSEVLTGSPNPKSKCLNRTWLRPLLPRALRVRAAEMVGITHPQLSPSRQLTQSHDCLRTLK
jgi:hypothetical protein